MFHCYQRARRITHEGFVDIGFAERAHENIIDERPQ
jgi:hypothetical protein